MDARDGPSTPEWRPPSSLSGPSAATSSMLRSGQLCLNDDQSSTSSGGDYSAMGPSHSTNITHAVQDIAPFETVTCERLTDHIRYFSNAHDVTIDPTHLAPHIDSLAEALRQAAANIRHNAKWFAPSPLAELLTTALDAATASSGSVDLSAAVTLIDAIVTYSALPPQCLQQIANFLSQTYYNATRANKTRKLADFVWTSMHRILESHLGVQLIVALIQIIGENDHATLESKPGYARLAGALMLISEKLLLKDTSQNDLPNPPTTELLDSLQSAAINGNDYLRELVMDIISVMLSDENATQSIAEESSWTNLLNAVDPCIARNANSKSARALVDSLVSRLQSFNVSDYGAIGLLCVDVGRPLDPDLRDALLSRWSPHIPTKGLDLSFEGLLIKLSASSSYAIELETLLDRSIIVFTSDPDRYPVAEYANNLKACIDSPTTTKEANGVLGAAMVKAMVHCTRVKSSPAEATMVFNTLCAVSGKCIAVMKFLLHIRADVERVVYFRANDMSYDLILDSPKALKALDGAILDIIEGEGDWDLYYDFIKQLPQLLGNHAMFDERIEFVAQLKMDVCRRLEQGEYPEPPIDTGFTKSHAAAHLIEILTAILSYHRYLSRSHILGLISVLLTTARSRDYIVSIPCIHALTICCYELPEIMSGYMDDVIDQMARMVTQRYLAIHAQLFLAGLSRLPELFRNNFKTHNYKMVLGVCGSYLQSIRGSASLAERIQTPSDDRSSRASVTDSADALPQYVYALAHHVIVFWYIVLDPQHRRELKEYIVGCLKYTNADGVEVIEDQGLVTIDMIDRVDADAAAEEDDDDTDWEFNSMDGRTTTLHRLNGLLLITTETALRTGKSVIIVRRPSGMSKRLIKPSDSISSASTSLVTITMASSPNHNLPVVPSDPTGATYGIITLPNPASPLGSPTILNLPTTDPALIRAIQFIDRTPGLDSHKAGVIYIGEGQTTEREIFQNVQGSPDYVDFIQNLGQLRPLKGADWNTQGLDKGDDMDGKFAIVWRNEVTEVVWHVTTLMPNDPDVGVNMSNKKRHVGNDFVNVLFNNSGREFDFGTFPSEFNAVYIVISPSARTSFLQTRMHGQHILTPASPSTTSRATTTSPTPSNLTATTSADRFYTVHVLTRPGYPSISSAALPKIVSGRSLPGYVRNLALNDCVFSAMWGASGGDAVGSWRSRMEQIGRVGSRFG